MTLELGYVLNCRQDAAPSGKVGVEKALKTRLLMRSQSEIVLIRAGLDVDF